MTAPTEQNELMILTDAVDGFIPKQKCSNTRQQARSTVNTHRKKPAAVCGSL
jgi:hypothetical protein